MAIEFVAKNSSKLLREYFSSAVNVLKNTLNISVQTNADFFLLSLRRIDEKKG